MLYKCDQCEFFSSRQDVVTRHKQSVHGVLKFHCDQCPFVSNRKDNLVRHKVSKHLKRPLEDDAPPPKKARTTPPTPTRPVQPFRPSVIVANSKQHLVARPFVIQRTQPSKRPREAVHHKPSKKIGIDPPTRQSQPSNPTPVARSLNPNPVAGPSNPNPSQHLVAEPSKQPPSCWTFKPKPSCWTFKPSCRTLELFKMFEKFLRKEKYVKTHA